ncbi:MAG: tRNA 2-thiocytidine biosynthesis protein TtcA [Bacilli bacterium]|nr:tRNA 2-thiocytidine biosynthesis protein TtcA [Bacilli bacterium]
MEEYKDIEKSIITTYRKEIWSKFAKGIIEYDMIQDGDSIMVCVSGGKDSFLMAKLFQELARHGKHNFTVRYVSMNPGYNKVNLEKIKYNAELMNIPLEIFESDIFEVVKREDDAHNGSPCYLCARMRRGYLYSKAQELGCNKIALAHHFNDVLETALLSMFYGSEIKTMVPKIHSENFKGLDLIRPLYLIKEKDIINWKKHNNLEFINCACPLLEQCTVTDNNTSKRKEMKDLISKLKETNPNIEEHLFKSLGNVNMSCILGYRDIKGVKHDFVDFYDDLKR